MLKISQKFQKFHKLGCWFFLNNIFTQLKDFLDTAGAGHVAWGILEKLNFSCPKNKSSLRVKFS